MQLCNSREVTSPSKWGIVLCDNQQPPVEPDESFPRKFSCFGTRRKIAGLLKLCWFSVNKIKHKEYWCETIHLIGFLIGFSYDSIIHETWCFSLHFLKLRGSWRSKGHLAKQELVLCANCSCYGWLKICHNYIRYLYIYINNIYIFILIINDIVSGGGEGILQEVGECFSYKMQISPKLFKYMWTDFT